METPIRKSASVLVHTNGTLAEISSHVSFSFIPDKQSRPVSDAFTLPGWLLPSANPILLKDFRLKIRSEQTSLFPVSWGSLNCSLRAPIAFFDWKHQKSTSN